MSKATYPISAPVTFVNTAAGDELDFNADDGTAKNKIIDFVSTTSGDTIYRNAGTENKLNRLPIGSVGDVLTASGTPVAEITTVTTVVQASVPASSYFLLNSPTTGYYVWYDTTGADTDPGTITPIASDLFINGDLRTAIPVDISGDTTANDVAVSTRTAIDALGDFSAPVPGGSVVTITNTAVGAADDAVDGATGTTFTIATPTPGVSTLPTWAPPAGTSTTKTCHAYTSGVVTGVPTGATWNLLDGTYVTWSEAAPGNDAGGIFSTGTFTPNDTGLWDISCKVTFEGNSVGTGTIGTKNAIRQVRLRKTNATAFTIAFEEQQASAFSSNPTVLNIPSAKVSLTSGDTIEIQVRHDADVAIDVLAEESASTYFSAHFIA